ncbi:MAG: hypothetical protein Aurels2KO_01540 [Aureliella sp.]
MGSLLGDALGGPVEFSNHPDVSRLLCNARSWDDGEKLDSAKLSALGSSLPLLSYESLRPDVASYGPWRENAAAGTVTDDSRHKIVLQRAVRAAIAAKVPLSVEGLAKQFVEFECHVDASGPDEMNKLIEEGLREYRLAANWILGERDLSVARPVERLWSGVNNCSGQMLMPTLAIAFAGAPERAYKCAFELDFVDTPLARDFTAALVAGLAAAIDPKLDKHTPRSRFEHCLSAMRNTDPYRISEVPFAGRQLTKWLDKADELVDRSGGSPKRLYRLLESEGKPVYWWDAHFTLLVPLSILKLADYSPLAAMHLTLDFGHDTDSYAQVLGAITGACCGEDIFPTQMLDAVARRMQIDFGESPARWPEELRKLTTT